MAKTLRFTGTQNDVPLTLHDNGDGTYSLQVAVVSDTSGVGGTTTNVVLLDGGATGLNSDAADVTGASGTSIFARLRGVVQLLASIKNAITGTLAVADSALSALFGTPADAVTGWPDQTVAPVSTTAVDGEISKALGKTGDAFRIANTGDGAPTVEGLLDTLYGMFSFYGNHGAFMTQVQQERTIDVSGLGSTFLYGPGPWCVSLENFDAFVGSLKFQGAAEGGARDIPVVDLGTGAILAPGTTLSGNGTYMPLFAPMAPGVLITCTAYTSGTMTIDALSGVGLSTFGFDAPGQRLGGVGTVQDAANQPKHLAANASTLIKSGPGLLGRVVVNKAGAGSNTLTLYDGTDAAGTVLAVIDTTVIGQREYQVGFTTGLYAVLATGTAADLTLTYA